MGITQGHKYRWHATTEKSQELCNSMDITIYGKTLDSLINS